MSKDAKSPSGSFVSSVATVLGGQAACAVLALAAEICYARLLGPEGRGQISLCLMAIVLGVLVGGMGAEGTIVLWSADTRRRATVWLPAVLLWVVFGCVMVSILWTVVYWKWHPAFLYSVNSMLAFIVLLSIPVEVLLECQMGMLVGEERFRTRANVAVIGQAAGLAGFVGLLWFGRTAENAMWGNLFGAVVGAAILAVILKNCFKGIWKIRAARESLFPTLSYGMRGQFGKVASFFNYRLDVFVVNYFSNPTQVGLYALGVVIAEALWQIPSAASLALFPRTARTIDQGATEFTCLIMRQVLLIGTVGAVAIGIGSSLLLPLIFGERFRPSVAVVWLLLPGTVALCLGRVGCSDLAGRGKSGYSSVFSIAALVVTVALDLLLIPRLGIRGAALASSAAYLTNTILILSALKYELKVTWRSLLVPSFAELASYQHAWTRFLGWLRPAVPLASGQAE